MAKIKRKYSELTALKGLIRERKTSYRKVAEAIGISVNTLCQKINGYYPMSAFEMENISEFLEIEPLEVARFFMPAYCDTQRRGA